jgi:hypothetical protein
MNKVLLHLSDRLRRAVDVSSIYYLEAVEGDTGYTAILSVFTPCISQKIDYVLRQAKPGRGGCYGIDS